MHLWYFFFYLAGLIQVTRALSHYNLLLQIDDKKPINIFNFFDNLKPWALILFMFYLIPLKKAKYVGYEKKVKLINLLLLIFYIFIVTFFIGFYSGLVE